MPEIEIITNGEGAWPDLVSKRQRGKLIDAGSSLRMAALPHGMQSGRASVTLRVDLPDGRTVVTQTSLRNLYNATMRLALAHGEDFMTKRDGPTEALEKNEIALKHVVLQLFAAQQRLGETPTLNMEAADAEWEEIQRRRQQGPQAN